MSSVHEVVKALHITVGLTVAAITVAYFRKSWSAVWHEPDNPAARYAVAIWGFCGLSQLICFEPLITGYLLHGLQPRSVPGLPDGWRVAYLACMLFFGAYILAVAPGELEGTTRRFWLWLSAMALATASVFLWLPYVPPA